MPRKNASKSLPFKDINPRLGADELVKRLKACLKYVEDLEELEDNITSELLSLSGTLVASQIVSHKQREVPLLSACILVCIVKLFIEDGLPFTEAQSKSIFSLFIAQLSVLENPSSSLFSWGFTLLENLATMKVFTYCTEFDAADVLSALFAKVVSVVNGDQSSQVHSLLLGILVEVLQETKQSLPMEAFDSIITCILEPQKSNQPVGYDFVCQLIKKTSLYLEHFVHVFFVSSSGEEESNSALASSMYDVLQALHEIDSSVLLLALPQLENNLQTTNETERMKVTKVLARMFSAKDSQLAVENKPLWQSFLGRFQDVSVAIRCECVTFSKYFLVYHPHLADETSEKLLQRLLDNDEKVRLTTVKIISEIAIEDLSSVPSKVICALQERMRDRKWTVRKESIQSLCRIFRHVMNQESLSESEREKIEWIPNKLLHCLFQKIREDNVVITRGFLSCIVPVTMDTDNKSERLLNVFNCLDENATRAFEDFLKHRKKLRQLLQDLVNIHQDDELKDNERKKLLLAKSVAVNLFLPDPSKSQGHMRELVSSLPEVSQDLSNCLDTSSNYKTITKAKSELLGHFSSRATVMESVKSLLDMSSPVLVDRECLKVLLGHVTKELSDPALNLTEELEEEEQMKCKRGMELVTMLSNIQCSWFEQESVLTDLLTLLRHDDQTIVENSILSLTKIGTGVQQWTSVASCIQPILVRFVTKGSPRVAKLSIRCIHSVYSETDLLIDRQMKNLVSLLDTACPALLTVLSSLSQIACLFPLKFRSMHSNVIHKFVVPDILDVENSSSEKKKKKTLWCNKEDLQHDVKLKIASIKLLVSWIIGIHSTNNDSEVEKHHRPVVELMTRILESDGNLNDDKHTSFAAMSHMRITAATGFLSLVREGGCMEYVTMEHFQLLTKITSDPCNEVREAFLTRLYDGLRTFTLPLSYLSLFCMATEVSQRITRTRLKEMLSALIKLRRDYYDSIKRKTESPDPVKTAQTLPEYCLPYVVHLVSHHDKFSRIHTASLNQFRDHLWLFLEPLVSKTDNFGFIQKLMDTMKETVCVDDPDNKELNKNMYATCDLVMGILREKMTTVTWGDFPGKVVLPKRLYMSSGKSSQPNDARYLPPDYKIYTDKFKSEGAKGIALDGTTPKKRKRPGSGVKKNTGSSTKVEMDASLSDVEVTPTKKRKLPSPKKSTSGRKRSPKKQAKIPFKSMNIPITSTPAIVADKSNKKSNAKRKVLQTENKKMVLGISPVRRSPRKRQSGVLPPTSAAVVRDIIPEEEGSDEASDRIESEHESPPPKISKAGPLSPIVKSSNIVSSSSTVEQSIKNRRRVKRRR